MHKKLTIAEIKFLKNFYKVNWPQYLTTLAVLEQFIERFEKHPEWQEKVIFSTINEESLMCGTFLMVYCNYIVYFNSLEAEPYTNLEILLNDVDFSDEKKFWSLETRHRGVIEKIAKLQNLEKTYDESSKCTLQAFSQDVIASALETVAKPPEGFYYDSLKQSDVPSLSALSHYKLPSWYFENVIRYNITTGLYTNEGKLVAWTAMHELGECGMTNVDENYRRNKLAHGVVMKHSAKAYEMGNVIFGHVFDSNETAMKFFNHIGHMEIIGSHIWINLRKNKKCDEAMKSQL